MSGAPSGRRADGAAAGRPDRRPDGRQRLDLPGRPKLRLRQWLALIGAIIVMIVLVALAVGTVATIRANNAITTVADASSPAAFSVLRLEKALLEQEAGVREYVLTGDRSLLDLYETGRADEAQALGELRLALNGLSDQSALDLRATASRMETWRTRFAEPVIADVSHGGPAAVDAARVELGRRLYGEVTTAVAAQRDRILAERAEARAQLERATRLLYGCYIGIGVALVLLVVAVAFELNRTITIPLSRLREGTRRVTTGDFAHKVEAGGVAEVVELAADVEAMRHRIVEELSAVRAAEAQLREQAVELNEQAAELRRSNAELEQFAYVASHDLQEPLRKVAIFSQMLQRRYAGQLDERADQYINFAVDGAKRMQTLINDLLAFSRVGRITREHVVVDCDDVLRGVVDSLGTVIEEAGAKVTADGDLPSVPGDPILLGQLFQNLVSNAIKFRGDEPPRVRLSARRDGALWELACADNGIGIDPQYADRIFVIFQRLHPKEDYPGTGLGLAMCKKIVEYHGGRIWLDPDVERGTTIRWTLPAESAKDGAAPDAASPHPPTESEQRHDDHLSATSTSSSSRWSSSPGTDPPPPSARRQPAGGDSDAAKRERSPR